jgi:hypothetical protein
MSPVSAVVICAAGLSGVPPIAVIRPQIRGLVAGVTASIAACLLLT